VSGLLQLRGLGITVGSCREVQPRLDPILQRHLESDAGN
jgi:hypothetical protein